MDDKRKKLIDRIVKLFHLSDHKASGGQQGTTEAEMMLAVTKARQLMAEHAISMADVELHRGHDVAAAMDARIRDVPVFTRAGRRLADYDWCVAGAVASLTDTQVFERRGFGTLGKSSKRPQGGWGPIISVLFVGDENDVALAGELFMLWLRDVRRLARDAYGGGNSWGKLHTSYAVGVAVRLQRRAEEMVHLSAADQQTWGLIVSNKKSAIERWKHQHVNPDHKQARKSNLDSEAFHRGYWDGDKINMQTKIVK